MSLAGVSDFRKIRYPETRIYDDDRIAMPNYGVIDLGSNTVRLCVYEVKDDNKESYTKKDFRSLLNNKAMAGLSAHVHDDVFSKTGINHAVDVLRGHYKRLKYFECVRVDVFATAVLRYCSNNHEAISKIEEETGFSITLLSEEEEAHLGFVGAASGTNLKDGLLVDIGGGSIELTRIEDGCDFDNISLALGSLSSFSKHVKGILPTEKEMESISSALQKKIKRIEAYNGYRAKTFYGIGGSVRALAKLYAEAYLDGQRPHMLTYKNLDELFGLYHKDADAFAHLALKAAPERIHTMLPGCLILKKLMDDFGGKTLSICGNGVREGYLIERMLLDD